MSFSLRIKDKIQKYILLIIKILFIVVLLIKSRRIYLNPFFKYIEKFYLKRVKVIGKENIPKNDGYVIISNHNFSTDALIIKNIFNNFKVIARKSIVSKFLNIGSEIIFYDKSKENIKKSGEIIKKIIYDNCKNKNKNILVFPEGEFSYNTGLVPFRKGLFYLCYENNIAVLPTIICVKKRKSKIYAFCFDNNIKVKIFKIVYPEKFKNFDEYYNYIYNKMNNYIKKHINNPNTKYSFLF